VAQSSDDEESDGASVDLDSDVEDTPVKRPTDLMSGLSRLKGQREQDDPLSRQSTAPGTSSHHSETDQHADVLILASSENEQYADVLKVSSARTIVPCKSPELPREKALLLGGQLWGKAGSSSLSTPKNEKSSSKEAVKPLVSDAAAKAAAKKMPKQCLFLGFNNPRPTSSSGQTATAKPRRALAPGAAKLRSHVSWAHHLPIRTPQTLGYSSSSATTTATPESSDAVRSELTSGTSVMADRGTENVTHSEPHGKNEVNVEPLAAVEPSNDEPPNRKKGPRYYFAPGSSRPMLAPDHTKKRDAMVLEFRTEPRIVPASRAPAKRNERRSEAFRFRPKSREWATEREVLAMH
jgi:hypothetical protein